MKAARVYGPGDVRIEDVPVPTVKDDEILVRVKTCGICGTDIHLYKVGNRSMEKKPIIPGHEFSGEIVEIGSAIDTLKVGDRIVGQGLRDCGECYWCRHSFGFCPNPKVPGEGLDGAFAEYVIVPKPMVGALVLHIPQGMTWNQAATIEPMSVSCYAVEEARLNQGEIVLILGAGVIGLGILQACKSAGASKVIVSEPSRKRREIASMLGADIVINPMEVDPVEAVLDTTAGHMAGVIFECSGSPAAFRQAPLMVRPFGKIIQVGIYERNMELPPDLSKLLFQFRNATIRGTGGNRWDKALEHMQSGKIKTDDMITHVFPFDNIKEAFEMQSNSEEAIKVLVEIP